jgi:uncharacterized protein
MRPTRIGVGWRPELAIAIERSTAVEFIEVTAENIDVDEPPASVLRLRDRGLPVAVHGLSLSLGGVEPLDAQRIQRLARLTARLDAFCVSEHVAFARVGAVDVGHMLPVPRSGQSLANLAAHVRQVMEAMPVPFALENIATLVDWPDGEHDEASFMTALLQATGAPLLLDVSNLYANARNHGWDARAYLDRVPLDQLAYVHIGGGTERDDLYHDTHAHAVPGGPLDLLQELCARVTPPAVMLERDDGFGPGFDLGEALSAIAGAVDSGIQRQALG